MSELNQFEPKIDMEPVRELPGYVLMAGTLTGFIWFDQVLQKSLKARGYEPVTRSESQVLVISGRGFVHPSDVSRALGVSRQAVNLTLKKLVKRKLITLRPDPKDRRCLIIDPSPEGWSMVEETLDILEQARLHLNNKLGRADVDRMVDSFKKEWGAPPCFA